MNLPSLLYQDKTIKVQGCLFLNVIICSYCLDSIEYTFLSITRAREGKLFLCWVMVGGRMTCLHSHWLGGWAGWALIGWWRSADLRQSPGWLPLSKYRRRRRGKHSSPVTFSWARTRPGRTLRMSVEGCPQCRHHPSESQSESSPPASQSLSTSSHHPTPQWLWSPDWLA